ncbi:MAG: pentapeptide repeat-containing protein [Clostridiales bacterium]|nr:pentapeptide repeat-containing protein [Clostridiales bacterium]
MPALDGREIRLDKKAGVVGDYGGKAHVRRRFRSCGARPRGASLGSANLCRASLGGIRLSGIRLGSARPRGARLGDTNLGNASLGGIRLGNARLSGASLSGVRLSGAQPAYQRLIAQNAPICVPVGMADAVADIRDAVRFARFFKYVVRKIHVCAFPHSP